MVVRVLIALPVAPKEKSAMLASQRSMPVPCPGPRWRRRRAAGRRSIRRSLRLQGEDAGEEGEKCEGGDPEAERVEGREGHAARADLRGQDEVAEARLRRGGENEEDHQRAVQGDEGEVVLGRMWRKMTASG